MCGIGIIYGNYAESHLNYISNNLTHRGPDDAGYFYAPKTAFGHRRLSIIDTTGGKQPIISEDGKKCIICNGEIYNYKELRKELKQDHIFKTRSDTEVALHLYEEYGAGMLEKLNGMFIIAIHDNGELFVARDRLGIKPLYYGYYDGSMVFASEIKALKGCIEITEFPPGHYYTAKEGFVQYYSLSANIKPVEGCEDQIVKMIREKLTTAVRRRMISDVPVGVFLSGGLDSSIIAALMKEQSKNVISFAVGTKDSSDILAARVAAKHIGTEHHEYIYTEEEMCSKMDEIIYYLESYDAPLVRSAIPNYFVARLAAEHVKVVLTGEGADELFCGYKYLEKFTDSEQLDSELLRLTNSLHNINLQRTDRMTMAHSLEGRVPFLDHEFAEFALGIPAEMKIPVEGREAKHLLRKAFEGMLPEEILYRKKVKFSEGAGFEKLFGKVTERSISNIEYSKEKNNTAVNIRGKDELYFYRVYNSLFSDIDSRNTAGVCLDF